MEKRVFTKDMAHIKTAEVIECPDCAFEFGTIHEQSEMPGLYSCPNCQESNLEADIFHLKEENKRLREALKFYTPREKYEDSITTTYGYTCEIAYDQGETARKALEGCE